MTSPALKADDLVPLVLKLSHDEQVRLAKLALRAASRSAGDASAYQSSPVTAEEFSTEDDPLARDADGWVFASAWKRRRTARFDELEVPVIGIDDLIANKRACGRPKDLADVAALEQARTAAKKR